MLEVQNLWRQVRGDEATLQVQPQGKSEIEELVHQDHLPWVVPDQVWQCNLRFDVDVITYHEQLFATYLSTFNSIFYSPRQVAFQLLCDELTDFHCSLFSDRPCKLQLTAIVSCTHHSEVSEGISPTCK